MDEGKQALTEVLRQLSDGGTVIFDLDSTLYWTGPRHLRILREFAQGDAELVQVVNGMRAEDIGYDADLALRAAGWGGDSGEFLRFWGARYFTSEYVAEDRPYPGALEFAAACAALGDVVYMTGRAEPTMGSGTRDSLARWGFAEGELLMKPSVRLPDAAFKAEAVARIRGVVATFENEPGNANLFARAFPAGLHFLVRTCHSPRAEAPLPQVRWIDGFGSFATLSP